MSGAPRRGLPPLWPDLAYDQPTAMGALACTYSVLHSDRAGRFLQAAGLWRQRFQDAPHVRGDDGTSRTD
ncbi:DUF6000 family protein [Streptomyces sp. NPDC092369]|uniref:DUF6000 family protein n=1 Tax=Streptomyces sp. NPDC092369 TaxID=3366015 RepID=UPI00381B7F39